MAREIIVLSDMMDVNQLGPVSEMLTSDDSVLFLPRLKGPAETRNLGIHLCRGEFLVLFDDDDELPDFDRHYSHLINSAIENRGALTYSSVYIREEDRSRIGEPHLKEYHLSLKDRVPDEIYLKNFILTPACIIPSFLAKQCIQDHYLRSLEDWDFLLNLKSRCDFRYVDNIGAIIYKDFINPGVRRSTTQEAKGSDIVNDYLYIYRRWPAPSEEIRKARAALLAQHGLSVHEHML